MVFSVIGSHLWANASGALGVVSGLVVLVLVALTVVGLVMAVVDTVRLHRRDGAVAHLGPLRGAPLLDVCERRVARSQGFLLGTLPH